MAKIVGFSGSLRAKSFNSALLRAAAGMMPPGSELKILSIADIPLFNEDVEAKAFPAAAAEFREAIAASDGLLIATPEYNNGIPGVSKNAIDWATRPSKEIKRVFGGKPVAMIGATPGGMGTILAQNAWLSVLRHLGTLPWFGGRLHVSKAHELFDDKGELKDDKTRELLKTFVEGFAAFADKSKSK